MEHFLKCGILFRIPLASENLGTYLCFVNNTVGLGAPCEIDLQGIGVLKNISDTNVIVIVAVIAAALVAAISLGKDMSLWIPEHILICN